MKTRWLHFAIMIITIICINSFALHANAQMADFCSAPPFVTLSLKPNVMLVVDNSGSMFRFAYFDGWNTAEASDDNWCTSASNPCDEFDPNYNYYGYFDPNYWYTYESNRFYPTDRKTSRNKYSNEWDGNFLNWLTMRRIDVIRKVLTGGRVVAEGGENRLIGEPPDDCGYSDSWRGRYKRISNAELYTPYSGMVTFTVCGTTGTARFSVGSDTYNVKVALGDTTPQGIIQKVGNKIRWGLSFYHPNTPTPQGGYVQAAIEERDNASLENAIVNEINNKTPDSNTPLAETLWTIAGYYAQEDSMLGGPGPRYQSGDYQINTNVDPYNYGTGGQPVWAWCAKSFVLLITDGEPCADGKLPEDLKDYANGRSEFNCSSRSDDPSDPCYIPSCYGGGEGGYVPGIEDVALYVHTTDLRDDLDSVQSLDIYTVFAFGAGSRLLEYAAINGGFKDLDGDGKPFFDSSCKTSDPNPYCKEWDADGDGLPDNYYEARSGSELEEALIAAITDILKRVSSGTAVSVLSTAAEGEGSIFQAYFNPVIFDGAREVNWLGYLQGLWVDKYGNLREDTIPDGRFVMTEDYIVRFKVDPATGDTKVERYADSDGDGDADYRVDEKLLSDVSSLWEAGKVLARTEPSNRTIYTFRDENNDGLPQMGEFSGDWFTTDNADQLRAYLGVPDDATAQSIVSFIRGEHVDGYRDRRIGDRVWKLGDIVHSTPGVVGRPLGQYHLIYGDRTYLDFYRAYRDRKIVVYAGANDGMLHAFEAGQYHEGDDPATDKVESGWFTTNGTFGRELWAFIPYNLLPHLRWLADPEYCHVYYVDLKPKIVDARIFADDDTHPHGWGTVLIGGMRFGGGPIQVTDDFDGDGHDEVRTFRSAYFAIDVTDPDNPQLLWEFTDPDLGYTTSYPAILRVGDPADKGTWYLIFGSGPTTLDGDSDHSGYIYVLDLATGLLKLKKDVSTIDNYLSGQPTFMASPVTVDLELDYEVDLAYIGLSYKTASGSWAGEVIRIETGEDSEVSNWKFSTLIKIDQPITAAPSVSLDLYNRLWIYWGTGRYYSEADKTDTSLQRIYGVWDPMVDRDDDGVTDSISVNDLTDVSAIRVFEYGYMDLNEDGVYDTTFLQYLNDVRTSYSNGSSYGWYINLDAGERVLDKATIIGGIVLIPSFKPNDDICGFGGDSYLYALYYETGTAYKESVIGTGEDTIEVNEQTVHEILKKADLGQGMPTTVAVHLGKEEGVVSLIQLGTGVIAEIDTNPAFSPKSKVVFWRERM